MNKAGLILHIEGTLCNTAHLHRQAWQITLNELGLPVRDWDTSHMSSPQNPENWLQDTGIELSQAEQQALFPDESENYRQLLAVLTPDDLIPGIKRFLMNLRAKGICLAVVSFNRYAVLILRRLGLESCFDAIVDGNSPIEDMGHACLQACACMDCLPEHTLVWETTQQYIASEKQAGLSVFFGSQAEVEEKLLASLALCNERA